MWPRTRGAAAWRFLDGLRAGAAHPIAIPALTQEQLAEALDTGPR